MRMFPRIIDVRNSANDSKKCILCGKTQKSYFGKVLSHFKLGFLAQCSLSLFTRVYTFRWVSYPFQGRNQDIF
jgi:hypothetical protein